MMFQVKNRDDTWKMWQKYTQFGSLKKMLTKQVKNKYVVGMLFDTPIFKQN